YFYSSRRRHTRFSRDWSSDVCSSDLDVDQPHRSWWFTVGGGIDPGETPHQAAVRELFEETGLRLDPAELVGPVIVRSAVFDFLQIGRASCRERVWLWVVRVP